MEKKENPRKWQMYINERNEYAKTHREEKRNYGDITEKCMEQPKLL